MRILMCVAWLVAWPALAADNPVERGLQKAGKAIERGAKSTGRAVDRAGNSVSKGAEQVHDKIDEKVRPKKK
jgi:hypothetical protein